MGAFSILSSPRQSSRRKAEVAQTLELLTVRNVGDKNERATSMDRLFLDCSPDHANFHSRASGVSPRTRCLCPAATELSAPTASSEIETVLAVPTLSL